eukprot:GHVS01090530.1.p1 GENE.GHVS01090530.1~~GHVS01090530.1.p1  ORF type:complete len:190 (-),score=50.91 GHVS01090530.1:206-775(-)
MSCDHNVMWRSSQQPAANERHAMDSSADKLQAASIEVSFGAHEVDCSQLLLYYDQSPKVELLISERKKREKCDSPTTVEEVENAPKRRRRGEETPVAIGISAGAEKNVVTASDIQPVAVVGDLLATNIAASSSERENGRRANLLPSRLSGVVDGCPVLLDMGCVKARLGLATGGNRQPVVVPFQVGRSK